MVDRSPKVAVKRPRRGRCVRYDVALVPLPTGIHSRGHESVDWLLRRTYRGPACAPQLAVP